MLLTSKGALSYVWGSKADPVPIYIGKHRRQVVYVTQSLDAALRSMRKRLGKKGGSAFYWIDALCINQKDNAEKSQQIPLMPLIYPAAYLTYCWLGQADETTDQTFAIIGNCANYLKAKDYQMAKVVLDVVITQLRSKDRSFIDGLQRLLRKPWFERAWSVHPLASVFHSNFEAGYCRNLADQSTTHLISCAVNSRYSSLTYGE